MSRPRPFTGTTAATAARGPPGPPPGGPGARAAGTGTCSSDRDETDDERPARLRHDPARRRAAGGPQPLRRRQARHRRAPRRARRRLHRGRLAGRQPQGHRVLRPGTRPSCRCATPRSPRSARPGAPVRRRPTTRRCAPCSTRAPRSSRSWPSRHVRHVELALRTTREENLAMVRDTVALPARRGPARLPRRRALLRRLRRRPRLRPRGAAGGGRGRRRGRRPVRHQRRHAARPGRRRRRATSVDATGARLGIHCHNDTGCAVANSLAAVDAGATPRAGHAQRLRRAHRQRRPAHGRRATCSSSGAGRCCPTDRLQRGHPDRARGQRGHQRARRTRRQPYVGASAFAHKAGLHASAIKVDPDLYQHTDPKRVGNDMRMLVSDMAGRASIELKGRELGFDLGGDDELVQRVARPGQGAGAARLHLRRGRRVVRAAAARGGRRRPAGATSRSSPGGSSPTPAATARRCPRPRSSSSRPAGAVVATGEGNGPVNALDHALRQALRPAYPELDKLELIDFRVRILDAAHGTDAVTRVLIETSDGDDVLGDGRRRPQHRRGLLAGPRRRHHLRPAAPGRVRPVKPARAVVPIRPDTCRSRPGCSRMEG